MKKFEKQVLELARELGDWMGQEVETVEYIASELQVSVEEVFAVFQDMLDPAE